LQDCRAAGAGARARRRTSCRRWGPRRAGAASWRASRRSWRRARRRRCTTTTGARPAPRAPAAGPERPGLPGGAPRPRRRCPAAGAPLALAGKGRWRLTRCMPPRRTLLGLHRRPTCQTLPTCCRVSRVGWAGARCQPCVAWRRTPVRCAPGASRCHQPPNPTRSPGACTGSRSFCLMPMCRVLRVPYQFPAETPWQKIKWRLPYITPRPFAPGARARRGGAPSLHRPQQLIC